MCYHTEFGRSALKDVDINIGEPQNWGALEPCPFGYRDVADHLKPSPLPRGVYSIQTMEQMHHGKSSGEAFLQKLRGSALIINAPP